MNSSHDQVIVVVVDLMHHAGDLVVNVLQHHLLFVILRDAAHDVADHTDEHVEHGERTDNHIREEEKVLGPANAEHLRNHRGQIREDSLH